MVLGCARKPTFGGLTAYPGMNEIDINHNHRVSFIEYLLYRYQKTVEDLFAERDVPTSASLIEALERAIEAFQATLAQRAAREEKMNELEALASVRAPFSRGPRATLLTAPLRHPGLTSRRAA